LAKSAGKDLKTGFLYFPAPLLSGHDRSDVFDHLSGTVILPGNRRLELHGGVNRFQWKEKENANNSFQRSQSGFRSNLCETE